MSPDMGQHGIGGLGMQCKGNEQYAIHNHLFAMEWKAIQAYVIYILTDGQTEVRLFSHVMKSCCSKERRASEDLIQKVLSISSISFRRYELAANVTNPSPSEPRDCVGVGATSGPVSEEKCNLSPSDDCQPRHLRQRRPTPTASSTANGGDFQCGRQSGRLARVVSVANVGNAYSKDVANMVVGLLIDVLRKAASDCYIRHGFWKVKGDFPLPHKSQGKRVGIVGLGSIGCEVGKGLETFGCTISYNSKSKKPSITYSFYSNVKELAENNVIIILCCSLTDETYHMVNKEVLSTLGKEGVIVNVGRGALINEKELVRCLVGEYIKGAGLDVFENDNASNVPEELFQLDNVVFFLHTLLYLLQSLLRRLLQILKYSFDER
ncbi:hypothetical protein F8388_023217 [Cannabis sativa]|uniref:glyoxylate reductase (NADP(+)) n=1 Tax=Cannabis sativa TaxID=3483 RepID=A0A7J6HDJ3_CANSA|nr:hypothetical protein F8388_023217 [Cannabis sativa]